MSDVKRRVWFVVAAGLMCAAPLTPAAGATSPSASGTTLVTMSPGTFEARLLVRTNYRRARHGCAALRLNAPLVSAARLHSSRMSGTNDLSHRLAGEGDLSVRAVNAGYTRWRILAENLAWGQGSPGAVFRAWVNSPEHRANLDNCRLRDVGFGVVIRNGRPWVTADFGRHLS